MSRAWSWRHAILESNLPATTKHVLMVLSVHMNDMGEGCYPSIKRISELCSLSMRSVCTHIHDAEAHGWLLSRQHGFNGQGWARHEYLPEWPKGIEAGSTPSQKGIELGAEGSEPDDRKAVNDVQSNIPAILPLNSSKPKKTKATKNANPRTSIAITLEHLEGIPEELRTKALERHGLSAGIIADEWAKFRNHHISSRSKHTRVDLCWDTWCLNVAAWKRTGTANSGTTAGRGSTGGYDKVAAAQGRAMAELFGEQPQKSGGSATDADSEADIWGTGAEEAQSGFVDVTPSDEALFDQSSGIDGGGADSDAGATVSHKVE